MRTPDASLQYGHVLFEVELKSQQISEHRFFPSLYFETLHGFCPQYSITKPERVGWC